VKSSRIVLLVAMMLYVASFFLSAGKEFHNAPLNPAFRGYECAYITLLSPWSRDSLSSMHEEPLLYFAILFSGWINPMFLITMGFLLKKRSARVGEILRIVLVLMFPACWIVYYKMHLRPDYGYYLWTAAMLVAMFAGWFGSSESKAAARRLLVDKVA
jgi:hypothetical protein